jgi:hypothetical protein
VKFRDAHKDELHVSEREPTGLIVNASGIFEKMNSISLHMNTIEGEMHSIYFKTIVFCILFTVVNLISAVLINVAMD